ncbi:hypothetical protein F511_23134 [Dorcoceras hygrometricum]|uniref:DNA-directed RNA polymerase V subunit 1 n=1 Tax=Dorcoceras hygrometricum TaxID=472368 RepID=A0A2Z7BJ60_9LAMI|nr:hypothetical protein F511_23134 [Dorcoceras hygrometricum]
MSLFDLQDVCMAIGSITTLDLPMVIDLIGIYGLKGPYRTLTTTDWFLQALSVIPRGSWGDVARRFTMIRWAVLAAPSLLSKRRRRRPPCAAAVAARCRRKFVSGQLDEENPFVQNSSVLLVQPDEGVSVLVVDRIGGYLPQSTEKSRVLVIPVGARHKCQQGTTSQSASHNVALNQIRQSGPRLDPRFLRQTALEVLTRSARSDSPRKTGRNNIPAKLGGGGGGGGGEREGGRGG